MSKKPIVALIYDFDGTLSPGNMQEFGFIQAVGSTPEEFWKMSDSIAIGQDASNVLAYMKLMFDEAHKQGIRLRRDQLRCFGAGIELFDGVREWFSLVNEYGRQRGVRVEHYINSSGLKEIIEGSPIASEFKHIFAGSFIYNSEGEAEWPGIAVDYTAKTQFLFKISKGIFSSRDNKRVNASIADDKKRIPFSHMIYFGDGETDVPCMKIVGMFGGNSIAVYNPASEKKKASALKLKRQGGWLSLPRPCTRAIRARSKWCAPSSIKSRRTVNWSACRRPSISGSGSGTRCGCGRSSGRFR